MELIIILWGPETLFSHGYTLRCISRLEFGGVKELTFPTFRLLQHLPKYRDVFILIRG